MRKTCTFLRSFYADGAVLRTRLVFLLGWAEIPLSAQFHVFAVWALWLEVKYTKPYPPRMREVEHRERGNRALVIVL